MTAPRRIAYQGEPGANSHQVCLQHYPEAEALACASFEDVFAAVEGGPGVEPSADLAMIPIDNSIAGRVADIHHFLPDSGLHIVAEHFLRIRFHLMGVRAGFALVGDASGHAGHGRTEARAAPARVRRPSTPRLATWSTCPSSLSPCPPSRSC